MLLFFCLWLGCLVSSEFTLSNATLATGLLLDWSDPLAWQGGSVPPSGSAVGLWCEDGPSQVAIGQSMHSLFSSFEFRSSKLFVLSEMFVSLESLQIDGNSSVLSSPSSQLTFLQSSTCNFASGASFIGLGGSAGIVCGQLTIGAPLADEAVVLSQFNLSGAIMLEAGARLHIYNSSVSGDSFICKQRMCTVEFFSDTYLGMQQLSGGFYEGASEMVGTLYFPSATILDSLMLSASTDNDLLPVFIFDSLQLTSLVTLSYL